MHSQAFESSRDSSRMSMCPPQVRDRALGAQLVEPDRHRVAWGPPTTCASVSCVIFSDGWPDLSAIVSTATARVAGGAVDARAGDQAGDFDELAADVLEHRRAQGLCSRRRRGAASRRGGDTPADSKSATTRCGCRGMLMMPLMPIRPRFPTSATATWCPVHTPRSSSRRRRVSRGRERNRRVPPGAASVCRAARRLAPRQKEEGPFDVGQLGEETVFRVLMDTCSTLARRENDTCPRRRCRHVYV